MYALQTEKQADIRTNQRSLSTLKQRVKYAHAQARRERLLRDNELGNKKHQ